jgi:hypothetical protein
VSLGAGERDWACGMSASRSFTPGRLLQLGITDVHDMSSIAKEKCEMVVLSRADLQ